MVGFKCFISFTLGKMIQCDDPIFQMGWNQVFSCLEKLFLKSPSISKVVLFLRFQASVFLWEILIYRLQIGMASKKYSRVPSLDMFKGTGLRCLFVGLDVTNLCTEVAPWVLFMFPSCGFAAPRSPKMNMSNEKRAPGCLGFVGGNELCGDYFINHDIRIPSLNNH